ncbi:type II toxin-antitoxin system MqsR family toxin [Geomonas sp. Red421]|uniref:Type II toxin-antitoxin system MqsR family toxin n=1 Tax=Geomonas anaerohicana TaxID=2798583 RepID=A0ABS0YAN3_9BACT|nr:type II toxin-antitoxin system MqsR family toxin [Geomonas anaerohicana]
MRGGLALGLTEAEMRQVVCTLRRQNFYKSMTTFADPRQWQDVYHCTTDTGVVVYIKVTWSEEGPPVIQFKKK